MREKLFVPVALAALSSVACLDFGKVDDAKQPGDLLGTFAVAADLDQSTCGAGALGSSASWRFEVKLSRYVNDLYWLNGREAIVGSIGRDGRSFSFETGVEVEVPVDLSGDPDCRIRRDDSAEGKLSDSGKSVESFEGSLGFSYGVMDGASCDGFLLTEGAPARLPCAISYSMTGARMPAD